MAITKSAKKALRQNLKRRKTNAAQKSKIKNLLKQVRHLVSQKKFEEDKSSSHTSLSRGEISAIDEAKNLLPQVYKILDKAAKTNLIKKNTASRRKSRITKLVFRSRQ